MTIYTKEEIRVGTYFEKDCSIAVEHSPAKPTLSDIGKRIERLRKKLELVAQVVATNKRSYH